MLADFFSILPSNSHKASRLNAHLSNLAILMMWLLGTSTTSYYQEIDAEEFPTVLGPL